MGERISITKAEARVYLRALGDAEDHRDRIADNMAMQSSQLLHGHGADCRKQARRYERAAESLRRKIEKVKP